MNGYDTDRSTASSAHRHSAWPLPLPPSDRCALRRPIHHAFHSVMHTTVSFANSVRCPIQ